MHAFVGEVGKKLGKVRSVTLIKVERLELGSIGGRWSRVVNSRGSVGASESWAVASVEGWFGRNWSDHGYTH